MEDDGGLIDAANAWYGWHEKATRLGYVSGGEPAHDLALSIEGILRERVRRIIGKMVKEHKLYEELEERLVREINELQGVGGTKI